MRFVSAILAGLVAFALAAILAHGRSSAYDNYVLLAQAFAHGQVAIQWPGAWIDALPFGGKYYIIEGPLPAVLLLPWVAIFGDANQTVLALLLCGVAVAACWQTCEQLAVSRRTTMWICAFLFAGTQLAWCAMLGDVWFIAHVAAVACAFLALAEVTGKRRGSLVALALVAAAFARFSLVLAIPVFAWLVVRDRPMSERRRAAIGFAAVVALGAGVWAAYNYARWGTWYDIGYNVWYNQDSAGAPIGSPFQLRYFPYQLWSFFWQGPAFTSTWPFVIPTYSGLALTWTSPALVIALFARRPRALVIGLWLATLLVAGPSFMYYVNGYAQFGMRHALDFEPFLVVLMALAIPTRVPLLAKAAIAWSVAVGFWGIWYWNVYYRH
ncbi:MAG TPA: hypothetical protein VGP41_15845 [Candidatus Lustribacter sp.]|nr:hypothetical protein [Candidatus Lustribacter sp.]